VLITIKLLKLSLILKFKKTKNLVLKLQSLTLNHLFAKLTTTKLLKSRFNWFTCKALLQNRM